MNKMTKIGLEYAPLTMKDNSRELHSFLTSYLQDNYPFLKFYDVDYYLDCKVIWNQLNKKIWKRVYEDDGCLELVTHTLKYHQALNTYREFYNICKKNKIQRFDYEQKETHYSSGGFHVNLDKIPDENLLYLMLDIANRPYLTWCFNDPADDENAMSLLYENKLLDWSSNKKTSYFDFYKTHNIIENNDKMFAISNRTCFNDTWIEFRLFDIPQCYEEFKCFIDIAIAIRNRALKNKELPLEDKKILKISKQQAWKLTLDFIEKELKIKVPQKVKKIWRMRLNMRYKFNKLGISKLN